MYACGGACACVVVGVTSRCRRRWACRSAAHLPARRALARPRPSRTWAAVSASSSSYSTAPTRWTTAASDAYSKVGENDFLNFPR